MSDDSTSSTSQTDWTRLEQMEDEAIDLGEIAEVTAEDLQGATLRVGGRVVPEDKSFVGILLDSDVLKHYRSKAGREGVQGLINATLRAHMAKV